MKLEKLYTEWKIAYYISLLLIGAVFIAFIVWLNHFLTLLDFLQVLFLKYHLSHLPILLLFF